MLLALATPPCPCVRLVLLALAAPPCPCPPLVRVVLLVVAAPPVLVRHLSALPRLHVLVRHLSACVRLVSALCCWLWPRPHVLARHLSPTCPPCVVPHTVYCQVLLEKKGRPRYALAASPELVSLVSAMSPLRPCLQTLSAMCPLFVRRCPLCAGSLSAQVYHGSAQALAFALNFVRSWPAVGQGRGIIKPLRNPQRLYCMPAWHLFFAPQIRPLQARAMPTMLEKLLGSMLV